MIKRSGSRRLIPVTLFLPLFGASLGVDGGPIFQIFAIENLELSPTVIGIAFGFGVVSVPIQLYASRIPLHRARRNAQLFLLIAAVQAWVLALLVGFGVTGPLASTALAITVTAEIALSVLFATAWQPLLSYSLDTAARQRLNATWPAMARGLLAALLVLFAALGGEGRAVFLAVVGLVALGCALGLGGVADPPREAESATAARAAKGGARLSSATRSVLVVLAAVNVGALPLWLVYLDTVLWPSANLGLIAGIQTAASMVALLALRPTDDDVSGRALVAAAALLAAVLTISFVGDTVDGQVSQVLVFAATAVIGAAGSTVRVAMLETAHRSVNTENSVRAFTVLDVVASTSLQLGLLVSGFLIAASAGNTWLIDPYMGFVLIGSVGAVIAVGRTRTAASVRPKAG